MAKQAAAKTKRNMSTTVRKKAVRARSRPALSMPPERSSSPVATTDWRFHFATLMRVSDNLVARAVGAYDRMFALDERDKSEIHLEMGKKLAAEEKLDEALGAFRKVLRVRPDHEQALFEAGMIHLRRGAPLAAIEMLQKAKAAGMKSHQLQLVLADALTREGRSEEALQEIDQALAIKPNVADTHYRRGVLLDRLDRHEEAVEAFESAIELAPREVRFHQSLGFTLETMGRRGPAIKCFKRALELERARELETIHLED